ncbi:MAG: lytic transglycosylase domain-containing protein, partial [Planctomycetota bacterium]
GRRWIAGGLVVLIVSLWLLPGVFPVLLSGAGRWGKSHWDAGRVAELEPRIREHAAAAGLDPEFVRAVVTAESGGDPAAKSNRGAHGLMQITAITEKDVLQRNPGWPRGDLFEIDYNLKVGTTYLAYLIDRFDGDEMLALTAYHMGPTAVRRIQRKHPGISPADLLAEHAGSKTRAYVRRVLEEQDG